jgi:hypothetical protein
MEFGVVRSVRENRVGETSRLCFLRTEQSGLFAYPTLADAALDVDDADNGIVGLFESPLLEVCELR